MSNYIVFYAGLVYGEYDSWSEVRGLIGENNEVYQGGISYCKVSDKWFDKNNWYTLDGCPLHIDSVPKELRAMILLLT